MAVNFSLSDFRIGRKLTRLLIIAVVIITVNIICYKSYRSYVLNNLGREVSVVEHSSQLTGVVPPEVVQTIHNQPNACKGAPFRILICVKSGISNVKRRKLVRSTWASQFSKSQVDARIVFIVGKTTNDSSSYQQAIEAESSAFQDIVQGNFIDAYKNITLKSIFLLSWATENCKNAEFIMSADDDTFINPANLLKLLKPLAGSKELLMGIRITGAKPYRHPSSKWYASYDAYNEEYYPPFLTGSGYVMSKDVMVKLHKCTMSTPLFHLDDVFVTGICAKKEGISSRYCANFTQQTKFSFGCFMKDLVTNADVPEEDFIRVWTEVMEEIHYSTVWCLFTQENLFYTSFVILVLFVFLITTVCRRKKYIYELFIK